MPDTTDPQIPLPTVSARLSAGAAIELGHVSKTFNIPHEQMHTLKQHVLHPRAYRTVDTLEAVKDISLDIRPGEFFGIVGRNGSGKSTLLKCLAGIYAVDSGTVAVSGRLAPFIELGVGFNPELTARDNAIINAIMLGLSRADAMARLDEIIAFAELEDFMDLKLKNYSSGMHVRLAFSVAVQVDADVLLIDEVLAVGDAAFQQKCFDQFAKMKAEGRTIVFVTHDMGAVQHFCDRAMLMDHGRMVALGDPTSIARHYNALNFRRVREDARENGGPEIFKKAPVASVISATFESPSGDVLVSSEQGEELCVRMEVAFHERTTNPIFGFAVNEDGSHPVFAANTHHDRLETGTYEAGEVALIRFRFTNHLGPGRLRLNASVAREGLGADLFDLHSESTIVVLAPDSAGGSVDLPHAIEIERLGHVPSMGAVTQEA